MGRLCFSLIFLATLLSIVHSDLKAATQNVEERNKFKTLFDLLFNTGVGSKKAYGKLNCPLCDSSVYSYCSEKLLHDACCCLDPYENKLPYQCKYADCDFLHANSCREHKLITACCCSKGHTKENQKTQKNAD